MPEETPPRVSVMEMTSGYVLIWDTGRTEAFNTIPQVTSAVKRGLIHYKPARRRTSTTGSSVTVPTPTTAPTSTASTEVTYEGEAFNFGRVLAEVAEGKLTLQLFEQAEAQYFPHLATHELFQGLVAQAKHQLVNHVVAVPEPVAPRPERTHDGQVNVDGTAWRCNECGRVSDCLINTRSGVLSNHTDGGVCDRCQQCLDNTCPMMDRETAVAEDLDAEDPRDVEPDEDSSWTTPAIVLNEKGERIGTVEV